MTKTTNKKSTTIKKETNKKPNKLLAMRKQQTAVVDNEVIDDETAPENKKVGAPKKGREKRVTTYMDLKTWQAIKLQSFEEGRTGNDIVLSAIELYLKNVGGPEKAQ